MKRTAKMTSEDVGEYNIWRCEHCECWHIGHKNKKIEFNEGYYNPFQIEKLLYRRK